MADEKSFSDALEVLDEESEATGRIENNRNDNAGHSNPERKDHHVDINSSFDSNRDVSTSSYSRETRLASNCSEQFNISSYGLGHGIFTSYSIARAQTSSFGASEESRASSSRVPIAAPRGIFHRTDNNNSNRPSQNCSKRKIWRPWSEMEPQNASFGDDINRCMEEENSASKFFPEQKLMPPEVPIEREESGAAPQTAEDGRQLSGTSAVSSPIEAFSSIERTTDRASVASLTGAEVVYANPKGHSSGHLNENNGDTCPAAEESYIEKSNVATSLIANNKQISLLPPPGRKRKHNMLSTLESLRGGMNNRHSDFEPSSSSHDERGRNEAAAGKSKNGNKMRRASARVVQGSCSSSMEMFPDSSALGSGSSSDASAVSVAGPSGTQAQSKKTQKKGSFVCDVCSKAFTRRGNLETHKRTHTGEKPFVCGVCGKKFAPKSHLTTHLLTHTGEKRFSCEFCGKGFNRKHHLEVHLWIHSGEKPYKCRWCGKEFSDPSSYRRHLKHVHDQE